MTMNRLQEKNDLHCLWNLEDSRRIAAPCMSTGAAEEFGERHVKDLRRLKLDVASVIHSVACESLQLWVQNLGSHSVETRWGPSAISVCVRWLRDVESGAPRLA